MLPHLRLLRFALAPLLLLGGGGFAHAVDYLPQGSFQDGMTGWVLAIAPDSKEAGCQAERTTENPHGGDSAMKLSSTGEARYALNASPRELVCTPGDRYRVAVWVRAGPDFKVSDGTPGFLIRVTMSAGQDTFTESKTGHFHVGLGNKASQGYDITPLAGSGVPTEWTKVEGVFEIPPDVTKFIVSLFVWKGAGSFFVDDASLEAVDKSTPLTLGEATPAK